MRMPGRGTTTGRVPGSGEAVLRSHGWGGVGGKQLLQVGAAAGLAFELVCRAGNKDFTLLYNCSPHTNQTTDTFISKHSFPIS